MFKALVASMRIPFLILTPVSIFSGFATARMTGAEIHWVDLVLVFAGALTAHVSVNMFNEYHDFRSGLDAMTTKTPFSGGSGALIANPKAVNAVLYIAILNLIVTVSIGAYFMASRGALILPVGIVGVLIILTYTQLLNRHPFLCLFAPGIAFGPLMVMGTHLILTGEYSMLAGWVSLVPFFLANNLLLLNQYPDIAADKRIGRRHFPIVYGERNGILLYALFAMATCGIIVAGVWAGLLPGLCLIALLPMGLTIVVFLGATKHMASMPELLPYLGMNIAVTVSTPVLLGVGIVFG